MSNNHGGKREGAGRKFIYNEPTKVLRVPESRIVEIKNYLKKTSRHDDISDIRQVDPVTHVQIQLAHERVAAGFPSPAQDYVDKTLDLNEHLIRNAEATFIVRVNSQSMLGIGIDINDELIVDRSLEAKHRDIVIALLDNDFTVKRLMIESGTYWLKAENPEFSDIHLTDGQELVIWGVVTRVIKNFR
ncbi:DNA polymerase V [Acinetobacter sp. ANC 4558]|uniref:LexA family protein n=1 Tax=Acinetobacter sp. ANC 4558 TaxID=1977876 RepID=UPI000A33668E|nr:translesion error-prone DNA polymerase V autoproteolytic subunit [Acinetobacter sp. ANC 4558]OTG87174.1 DNA polymerase V [Acinetobacter sp. ANC 4558]